MTKTETSGWLKQNVASVVTWVLIVVAGAVIWGETRADVSMTVSTVDELKVNGEAAKAERATLKSDVRVIETKVTSLSAAVERAGDKFDRLDRAVTRLEAVASGMAARHP